MDKRALFVFIIRCIWITIALVVWIIALNIFLKGSSDGSSYWTAGLICLIPMAFPVIRFILRMTGAAAEAGSHYWDVDITSNGHIYVSNHRFLWGFVTFIIVTALTVLVGVFILPAYWLYFVVCTVIMAFRIFKR